MWRQDIISVKWRSHATNWVAHICKFGRSCWGRRISSSHIYFEDNARTVPSQEDFQLTPISSQGCVQAGGFPVHTNIVKLRVIVDRETGCVATGGFRPTQVVWDDRVEARGFVVHTYKCCSCARFFFMYEHFQQEHMSSIPRWRRQICKKKLH